MANLASKLVKLLWGYFESQSETAFYFGCNIFMDELFVLKMINTLTTKKMPGMKSFLHIENPEK